jgi:hypothetical protein
VQKPDSKNRRLVASEAGKRPSSRRQWTLPVLGVVEHAFQESVQTFGRKRVGADRPGNRPFGFVLHHAVPVDVEEASLSWGPGYAPDGGRRDPHRRVIPVGLNTLFTGWAVGRSGFLVFVMQSSLERWNGARRRGDSLQNSAQMTPR